MKRVILIFIIVLCFVTIPKAQLISYNGKSYFINGINIPWHKFNLDFGTHYIYGANYDPVYFDSVFTQCQSYGVNCVRIWLHDDGGTTPEFDSQGYVTGLDTNFFSNLDNFFQFAMNHNLMVIPSIWDFSMCNADSAWGKYGGMHADLIQDTNKTRSYINNVLVPMVARYANQCNLLAWEIINEPEWVTDVSGNNANITQHVTIAEMQRFVGMLAEAIHKNSNKMVTVGSASIKYNSDKYDIINLALCVGNLWKDAAIQAAYNKPLAHLDFYSPHYYDWMKTIYQNFSPYDHNTGYWGFDKPAIVEETPGISSYYTPTVMLDNAFNNNYAGAMFWCFNPTAANSTGDFDTVKSQLLACRNIIYTDVDFNNSNCLTGIKTGSPDNSTNIFPDPATNEIQVISKQSTVISIEVYNMPGEKVYTSPFTDNRSPITINIVALPTGMYFVEIKSDRGVIVKKFIKN